MGSGGLVPNKTPHNLYFLYVQLRLLNFLKVLLRSGRDLYLGLSRYRALGSPYRRLRKGVGGRGLATDRAPTAAKIVPQNCVLLLLLLREEEEKGCRNYASVSGIRRIPRANPLLETSDLTGPRVALTGPQFPLSGPFLIVELSVTVFGFQLHGSAGVLLRV